MHLQASINAQLINTLSGKTRDEEIIISHGIGGRLPSDYSPAYKKAVKIYKKICNSKHNVIERIDDSTALLSYKGLQVTIRIR